MYLIKEENMDLGFGSEKVYNIYYKLKNGEEVFECTFTNKEKAENYIKFMK